MYNDIFNHKLFVPGIRWITPVYVTLKIQPVALETKRSLMNTAAMISQNSLESVNMKECMVIKFLFFFFITFNAMYLGLIFSNLKPIKNEIECFLIFRGMSKSYFVTILLPIIKVAI